MTRERKMVVGLDDIQAITIQCCNCNVRLTLPIAKIRDIPRACNHCNTVWWTSSEIGQNFNTEMPASQALIGAIHTLRMLMREKKESYRILLEFDEC